MLGLGVKLARELAPTRPHPRVNGELANRLALPVLGPADRCRDLVRRRRPGREGNREPVRVMTTDRPMRASARGRVFDDRLWVVAVAALRVLALALLAGRDDPRSH